MALQDLANFDLDALGTGWLALIFVALVWKLIWYGLALYRTIERKHKAWFVALFLGAFLLNDLGLLAIIYLIIFKKKSPGAISKKKKK